MYFTFTLCPAHLGNVVDEVLVAVLRIHLAQLGQPLQVALDLVLLALQRQAVIHHRLGLLHLLGRLGVSDGSPLHGPLVLCFLLSEPHTRLRDSRLFALLVSSSFVLWRTFSPS